MLALAAIELDFTELLERFLELAGESRAVESKSGEQAMGVDDIEKRGLGTGGWGLGAGEDVGFQKRNPLEAPGGRQAFSVFQSRREEIPAPSRAKRGCQMVPVPLWLAPKLALYVAMREQRVSNSELARRLGVHERVVRRMIDPQRASKAEKIPAALGVLGKQMTVEVRDAA